MTVAKTLPPWKPPRPKPELQPATSEQAREYMSWFVNRRAYTRQKDKPNPESGKYFFYQARSFETKERMALDTETIRKHLAGTMTIGLYAINPETQTSKWVAIDGDYADAYRDLRLLRWELQQDGVQALVEMSALISGFCSRNLFQPNFAGSTSITWRCGSVCRSKEL
jgi:hypothetical protein